MNKVSRLWPPGFAAVQFKIYFILGMVVSVLFSMGFLVEYFGEVHQINSALLRAARMGTEYTGPGLSAFSELIRIRMVMFPLYMAGSLLFVMLNYYSFWQESKSIYVMRRVRSPWELHVRCWALPLMGMAVILLAAVTAYWIYYGIYFWCAPEGFVPAQEILLFWRYMP